ncbi:MAG: hypothetical protein M3Y40_05285 [Chloroflexota bacterium]|nr:hypothetical protein [Chloroflexota bacterium]
MVRRHVQGLALVWVAFEVALAFVIEMPVAALVVAALFAIGAWWVGRPGLGGILLVGALALMELVFVPTYPRDTAFDWASQAAALVLALVTLAACWRARRG